MSASKRRLDRSRRPSRRHIAPSRLNGPEALPLALCPKCGLSLEDSVPPPTCPRCGAYMIGDRER